MICYRCGRLLDGWPGKLGNVCTRCVPPEAPPVVRAPDYLGWFCCAAFAIAVTLICAAVHAWAGGP